MPRLGPIDRWVIHNILQMSITREMGLNLYRTGILNSLEGLEVQNLLGGLAYLPSMRILGHLAKSKVTVRLNVGRQGTKDLFKELFLRVLCFSDGLRPTKERSYAPQRKDPKGL